MATARRTTAGVGLTVSLLLVLAGCGVSVPSDPEGTLRNITGGTLRVGVTESGQWVQLEPGAEPEGIEPDLVRGFADQRSAEIEWVEGAEHELVEDLEHGAVDLIIGGLESDTPWTSHAGMTRPYVQTVDERGTSVKHVMLVPMGENAFLLELDQFLQSRQVRP